MSAIIEVENLGKKYILNHQEKDRYVALRDVIANSVKRWGKRVLTPFRRDDINPDKEEFWALKNVSFEIQQGDRVGIIGRNGAGKSTLLKILSRITEPTTGRARIRGRVASLLEVGTGFHPELTGRENIYLNGAILGMSRDEIRRKFDEIIDFAEVEKFLDTPVKRYSSGMYVRLAFAVAAHLEPEILVVDEVLAVGDSAFQKKCLGKMGEIGKEGRTVLFVSHNMAAIRELCHNCIWLNAGQIIECGESNKIVAKYLNSSNTNQADVTLVPNSNAKVAFERIWVSTSDGKIASDIDITQEFDINMQFVVRETVRNVDIGVWMSNIQDRPICYNALSDMNDGEIVALEPGSYICSFRMPRKFLVADTYKIMIKAHIPNYKAEDYHKDIISFSIIENGSKLKKYKGDIFGCVLTELPWSLHKKTKNSQ